MSVNQVNQTTGALSPIAGGTLYADAPVGSIQAYGGATAPWGWLLCQGQAVSRATYAELFGVIGTSFGSGDGSTTFDIPDMREVVPVGAGTSTRSGIATHDTYSVGGFKDDQVQDHSHNYSSVPQDSTSDLAIQPLSGGYKYGNKHSYATTTNATGRHGDTTHGKQLGVNYIIKATTIALPSDFEAAVDEKIDDITSIEYNSATLVTQSNYTFTKCQYTKSGHLCTAFIQLNVITNAISEINCASGFPGSAQDGANAHFWAFRWDNFNVDPVGLYINQHGNLLVKGGISGGSSPYVVAFTYITTD